MQIKININVKDLKINRVVKYFILSDLFLWGGWGVIAPIFSVFVIEKIPGATLFTVGMVTAIYWIVKSIVQMPVAIYLDKHDGERDDFYALLFALLLAGFSALLFLIADSTFTLYVVSVLHGIAFGFYVPSWSGIFSRHIDKKHYAFDWSLDSTTIGISSGVAAFVGGVLSRWFGFEVVFIITSVASFISAFLLMAAPNLIMPGTKTEEVLSKQLPVEVEKVDVQ